MSFIHDQPEFSGLMTAVERETRVEVALVEKDDWASARSSRSLRSSTR
jgi:glycerol-3-phosphate dehydrogenase